MKLNKTRQKLYLDGKVGLINDNNDVEQLREVTNDRDLKGILKQYDVLFEYKDIEYHPISWFYENETELPKVGEWWECVENVSIDGSKIFTSGKKYKCEDEGYLTNNNKKRTLIAGFNDYRSHFTKSTPPTPTSYKLNIDIPEWVLKAGDAVVSNTLPTSILNHIATPCITFTLENGTEIELTQNDIDKIKKM